MRPAASAARAALALAMALLVCLPAPAVAHAGGGALEEAPSGAEGPPGAEAVAASGGGERASAGGGGGPRLAPAQGAPPPSVAESGYVEPGDVGLELPSVSVELRGAGEDGWSHAADAFRGQAADYLVTAVLPSDLEEYAGYNLSFTAALIGLEAPDESGVTVRVDGEDVTADVGSGCLGALYSSPGAVGAGFYDVLAAGASGGSVVTLEFSAGLAAPAPRGGRIVGECRAYLGFTADKEGLGTSSQLEAEPGAWAYTYTARIHAESQRDGSPLAGAGYTVRVKPRAGAGAEAGKYVGEDGELASEPHVFSSGGDGIASVAGLDAGEYTVEQVAAPEGFAVHPGGFDLVVEAELDRDAGTVSSLSAAASGNMGVRVAAFDAAEGTVDVAAPVGRLGAAPEGAPEADMRIRGVGDAAWGRATDSFAARYVDVEARVTLPGDVCEYGSYALTVQCLTPGMYAETGSVAVSIDGVDVTGQLDSYSLRHVQVISGKVTLRLADALGLSCGASGGSVVTIGFRAANSAAYSASTRILGRGSVAVTHAADKDGGARASFETGDLVANFTYSAGFTVTDSPSGEPVRGARVAVRVVECGDAEAVGRYASRSGSFLATRITFLTDAEGKVYLPGLDSGVYAVEFEAPQGYRARGGEAVLEVEGTLGEGAASPSGLRASASGAGARVVSADAGECHVEVAIETGRVSLPATGSRGRPGAALASLALAGGGLAAARRAARQRKDTHFTR